MNTPVIAVIILVALIFGSALSILNKACKSGYRPGALQFPPCGIVQKLSRLREYFTTKWASNSSTVQGGGKRRSVTMRFIQFVGE